MTWSLSVSGNCKDKAEEAKLIQATRDSVATLPGANHGYLATQHHGSVNLMEPVNPAAEGPTEVRSEPAS